MTARTFLAFAFLAMVATGGPAGVAVRDAGVFGPAALTADAIETRVDRVFAAAG